jgi:hypothetical protein
LKLKIERKDNTTAISLNHAAAYFFNQATNQVPHGLETGLKTTKQTRTL